LRTGFRFAFDSSENKEDLMNEEREKWEEEGGNIFIFNVLFKVLSLANTKYRNHPSLSFLYLYTRL